MKYRKHDTLMANKTNIGIEPKQRTKVNSPTDKTCTHLILMTLGQFTETFLAKILCLPYKYFTIIL